MVYTPLVKPAAFFDERPNVSLLWAGGVVLIVSFVVLVSFLVGGWAIAQTGDGVSNQIGEVIGQLSASAFVSLPVIWVVLGVIIHVLSWGGGSFKDSLIVTAAGLVPIAFQVMVVLIVIYVYVTVLTTDVSSVEAIENQLHVSGSGSGSSSGLWTTTVPIYLGIAVWQAYIWIESVNQVHTVTRLQSVLAGGLSALLMFLHYLE
ncbi:MAG: YIP1 family protein, partial [Halobacteria archaeon]|nr:YIP1 family protein [Halobacteria archaeon]